MTTSKPTAPRKSTPANAKTTAAPATTPVKAAVKKSTPQRPKSGIARAKPQVSASATAKAGTVKPTTVKTDKKKDKPEKVKVLRDSFTIPKTEFAQITALKKRAMALDHEVKKSELIRAGLLLLSAQNDAALLKALRAVPTLKTGRPGKA